MIKIQNSWAQAIYIACALSLMLSNAGYGQPDTAWTKAYRGAASWECQIKRTSDGGFALGGYGNSERIERDGGDFKLVKFDSLADLEWLQFYTIRQPEADQGFAVVQLQDSGYVVGGRAGGCTFVRTDVEGDSLWTVIYDREEIPSPGNGGLDFRPTSDGNFVAVSRNVFAKVSERNGDIIWSTEPERSNAVSSVLILDDGGFLLCGFTSQFGPRGNNIYIAKTDNEGELEWEQAYGLDFSETPRSIIPVSGGGYIIAGNQMDGEGILGIHPFIIRIDDDGELIWMQNYSDLRGDNLRDIVETPDGGFAVCGFWGSSSAYLLIRVDYSGEILWRTMYRYFVPRTITGEAYNMFLMEDGGYLLVGFSGEVGCWLVRTEPDPVDIPFELEIETNEHDFGEVPVNNVIDTVGVWELELRNVGRRYAMIDTLWFEGDTTAFSCALELPFRIDPEDTSLIPILFRPPADSAYTSTLILPYGNDQTLEIALSGRGVYNDVSDDFILHPSSFSLSVSPNPFNSTTSIVYTLPTSQMVTIRIFDLSGREVSILYEGMSDPGVHSYAWDASMMSSGTYVCRMEAGKHVRCTKLVLMR